MPLLLAWALVFASAANGLAPHANATEFEPSWVPQPRGRGTWSLLLTCTSTIIFCIWTSTHNDVIRNASTGRWLWWRLKFMAFAFFGPEIVITKAYLQWKEAREVRDFWCNHFSVKPGSEDDRLGMEGAFFVVMDGFSIGPSDYRGRYPSGVSSYHFKRLVEEGAILPSSIDRKAIVDRGKASTIEKLLALSQAFAIVIQCIMRWTQNLPVTPLELHVVIHVVMTAISYAFWWYKPQDVRELIPIIEHEQLASGEVTIKYLGNDLLMGLIQPSATGTGREKYHSSQPPAPGTWFIASSTLEGTPPLMLDESIGRVTFIAKNYPGIPTDKVRRAYWDIPWSDGEIMCRRRGDEVVILPGEALVNKDNFLVKYCGRGDSNIKDSGFLINDDIIMDIGVLPSIADQARVEISAHPPPSDDDFWSAVKSLFFSKPAKTASSHDSWDSETFGIEFKYYTLQHINLPLFALYGAMHAAGWNDVFPTKTEQLLWRLACSSLIAAPLLIFILVTIQGLAKAIIFESLCMLFGFLVSFYIMLASIYLTIASFISVRHLPIGAYKTVVWENIWPRI